MIVHSNRFIILLRVIRETSHRAPAVDDVTVPLSKGSYLSYTRSISDVTVKWASQKALMPLVLQNALQDFDVLRPVLPAHHQRIGSVHDNEVFDPDKGGQLVL